MTQRVDFGVAYGSSGKLMDVYRSADARSQPVVLLWHGRSPDGRSLLEPLARAIAEQQVVVFVPDWRPDAADGGRGHLLESIAFVRSRADAFGGNPHRVLLAGWSRGAKAAAGIAVDISAADGWRPAAVACLATGYDRPTPVSARIPLATVQSGEVEPIPLVLLHGVKDELVDIEHARHFANTLREHGWPVRLHELDTDHFGIVMAQHDFEQRRPVPTTHGPAFDSGKLSAALLAAAASNIP